MIIERKLLSRVKIFTAQTTADLEYQYDFFVNSIMSKGATVKGCQYQTAYNDTQGKFQYSIAIYYEIPKTAEQEDIKK